MRPESICCFSCLWISTFNVLYLWCHSQVCALLLECLVGGMRFLRGEYLSTDPRSISVVGDVLTLAAAKVKNAEAKKSDSKSAGGSNAFLEAFMKQISGLRSCAARITRTVDGVDEALDPTRRWRITDHHIVAAVALKDAKPLLGNVQMLAALFENLSERAVGDLMYVSALCPIPTASVSSSFTQDAHCCFRHNPCVYFGFFSSSFRGMVLAATTGALCTTWISSSRLLCGALSS